MICLHLSPDPQLKVRKRQPHVLHAPQMRFKIHNPRPAVHICHIVVFFQNAMFRVNVAGNSHYDVIVAVPADERTARVTLVVHASVFSPRDAQVLRLAFFRVAYCDVIVLEAARHVELVMSGDNRVVLIDVRLVSPPLVSPPRHLASGSWLIELASADGFSVGHADGLDGSVRSVFYRQRVVFCEMEQPDVAGHDVEGFVVRYHVIGEVFVPVESVCSVFSSVVFSLVSGSCHDPQVVVRNPVVVRDAVRRGDYPVSGQYGASACDLVISP